FLVLFPSAAGSSSLPCWQPATELPASYQFREFASAGGLMSGINRTAPIVRLVSTPAVSSQGRKAGRLAGRAADQVRSRDQSDHRQSARTDEIKRNQSNQARVRSPVCSG